MFHLFNKIYLDHEIHIHSKYDSIILFNTAKDHPISRLVGRSIGIVQSFSDLLMEKFQGDIEVFWKTLLNKSDSKKYILFADSEIYFQLQIQYWKSIFKEPSGDFLFELYEFYRKDYDLKLHTHVDRGNNMLGPYRDLYPKIEKTLFNERAEKISPIQALMAMNKDLVSYEYLLANYFYNKANPYAEAFKKNVLRLAWQNWCLDILDLKAEIIAGGFNIDRLFPELEGANAPSTEILFKSHPKLSWILDQNIQPGNTNYITQKYPEDFFPQIQSLIDKVCKVNVKVKGIELNDIDIFNQASQTKNLYRGDFESIIMDDVKRSFGSFFLKGENYAELNHYLVNFIYKQINLKNTDELRSFSLA
jgi:hypothetical protein